MERIMVPPVLRITGRNFSTGMRKTFTLAKKFAMNTKIIPMGASAFFTRSHHVTGRGGVSSRGGGRGSAGGMSDIAAKILNSPVPASTRDAAPFPEVEPV